MSTEAQSPRISVVIAAYNVQDCLSRAVESVLAQDLQDFEVLVVDDGSADGTLAVARELAARDARVRVFSLGHNQGPSAARNRGLGEARGEWVSILDADDVFLPGRLGHLLELAQRRNADMVADDMVLYDQGADQHLPPAFGWAAEQEMTLDLLLERDSTLDSYPFGWIQPMWRRGFLRAHDLAYPVQYRYMEDFFLLASALLAGAKVWLSPRAEYVYTMRYGPISKKASKFSATKPSVQQLEVSCQELMDRYRGSLRPRHVRALKRLRRRFAVRKAMVEAIALRRSEGLLPALLMLRRHPLAAWALAMDRAALAFRRRTPG